MNVLSAPELEALSSAIDRRTDGNQPWPGRDLAYLKTAWTTNVPTAEVIANLSDPWTEKAVRRMAHKNGWLRPEDTEAERIRTEREEEAAAKRQAEEDRRKLQALVPRALAARTPLELAWSAL